MPRRKNFLTKSIDDFREGIATTIIGFAYGYIIEALIEATIGMGLSSALIAAGCFVYGIGTGAQTLSSQRHWFVLGVVFISWFLDPISTVLSVGAFLLGWYLRWRQDHSS